jgi:hypothetical protein
MSFIQVESFDKYLKLLDSSSMVTTAIYQRTDSGFWPKVIFMNDELHAIDLIDEMRRWADESLSKRYHVMWTIDWWFESEADAILFKLRWL